MQPLEWPIKILELSVVIGIIVVIFLVHRSSPSAKKQKSFDLEKYLNDRDP